MLMALCDHLTHREGVGSMPDNTCTRSKGHKETKVYLSSWLTHRAQWQLRGGRSPLHPQALFIFSSSRGAGVGQLKWCILMNIYWPKMLRWQTCGQADTEASLFCPQGCDTADISLHGAWPPAAPRDAGVSLTGVSADTVPHASRAATQAFAKPWS